MTDVGDYIQYVLDAALSADGVRSHWLRKAETDEEDPDEYLVYTIDGDPAVYADDRPIMRTANAAIRYYYREALIDTAAGRAAIKARARAIAGALESAGFALPNGYFDVGDIDDIGFGATVFEAYYARVA